MRRYNNLFAKIVEMENLYIAFAKAKKGKSWQDTVKIIEDDLDENLFNLRDSLMAKSFTTSPYTKKQINQKFLYANLRE